MKEVLEKTIEGIKKYYLNEQLIMGAIPNLESELEVLKWVLKERSKFAE